MKSEAKNAGHKNCPTDPNINFDQLGYCRTERSSFRILTFNAVNPQTVTECKPVGLLCPHLEQPDDNVIV